MDFTQIGLAVGSILVVFILTIPFKETIVYRFAEYSMVGVMTGVTTVFFIKSIYDAGILKTLSGNISGLIGILLGILMLFRISRKYKGLANYSIAVIAGVSVGTTMRGAIDAQILKQIISRAQTVVVADTPYSLFLAIFGAVQVFAVLYYFIFTIDKTSPVKNAIQKVGWFFMLATFGATFGNAIMTRIAYISNSFRYVLSFLGLA